MEDRDKKRILVIRLSALGDVAMTVPVLLAVTRTYPGIEIIFITKDGLSPVPNRVPGVKTMDFQDNADHKGLLGIWQLSRTIKRTSIDGIADLHAVLRTWILKGFLLGSGLPYARLYKGRAEKRRLILGKESDFHPLKRTVDRYAEVFAQLGHPVELSPVDVLPGEPWPGSMAHAWHRNDTCRIGLAPFAAYPGKCYPPGLMKKVISGLARHPGTRIYLFGGGKQEISELGAWEDAFPNCVSVAGRVPLEDELALISNLDLMVSMDSGNGHLAAMYGIPVITIWGVTHPHAGFGPFNQPMANSLMADKAKYPKIPTSIYGNKAPEGYLEAIATISPDQIIKRIREILEQNGAIGRDSWT